MDRSRTPRAHPRAVGQATIDTIVAMKERYPSWGAKKLRCRLQVSEPKVELIAFRVNWAQQ